MKINTLLGIIAIALFGISCDNNATTSEKPSNIVTDSLTTDKIDSQDSIKTVIVEAIYKNATVYAGATDYYFENAATQALIEFRNSNLKEEITVEMPDNMLQESEEGPPEANQKLVGKVFLIHFIDEVITKVELKKKK